MSDPFMTSSSPPAVSINGKDKDEEAARRLLLPTTTTTATSEGPALEVGEDGGRLSRTESLMEVVRARLETGTHAFLVPGISQANTTTATSTSNSKSSQSLKKKHRLQPRKTCGREISVSFRLLLLSVMTGLMIITQVMMLTTQIVISRDISNSLIDSCNNASNAFLNASTSVILETLRFIAMEQLYSATVDLQFFLANQAGAEVGSVYNFVVASQGGQDPLTIVGSLPYNQTSVFITRQVASSFANWIDGSQIGNVPTNNYVDSFACHTIDNADIIAETGTCPLSTGVTTSNNSLIRCSLLGNRTCTIFTNFTVVNQIPVISQRIYAQQNPSLSQGRLIWSSPYILQGFTYQVEGQQLSTIGIGLSYPVFSQGCTQYTCVDTFIWAPLTARSLAGFALSQMFSLLNLTSNISELLDDAAFYIVDGRATSFSGTLLGAGMGKDGIGDAIIPATVYPASQSSVPTIRDSAQFLINYFGAFDNSVYNSYVVQAFDTTNLQPCSPDQLISQSGFQNCTLVTALAVESPPTAPVFITVSPMRFVVVFTIPLENLAIPLASQYFLVQQQTNNQRLTQQNAIVALIGTGVGIAIGAILLGLLLAWVMSVRISEPISKLDRSMRKVMSFNFKVAEGDYLSRVSDIARAEKTMESLSYAIEVFSKFVPETVVRGIVQGRPQSTQLHVEHRVVTVAFSDIKGFTTISEKLEISDLLFFLTRYLTVMTEVVELYEGTVTEILGDGLLILWNAPDDCELHAAKACACALAMQAAVEHVALEFHPILSRHGLEHLSIRVGLHTGKVLAGNIGSSTKLKYGCLGDTVNTASRLEGLCKLYEVGVICSEDTVAQLPKDKFQIRELDCVQVKGKDQPLGLFEVQGLKERITISGESPAGVNATTASAVPKRAYRSFQRISTAAKNVLRVSLLSKNERRLPLGEKHAMKFFGPIGLDPDNVEKKLRESQEYEKALHLFQTGQFTEAMEILNNLKETDAASRILLNRAAVSLKAYEQGELDLKQWKGINRLTEKF